MQVLQRLLPVLVIQAPPVKKEHDEILRRKSTKAECHPPTLPCRTSLSAPPSAHSRVLAPLGPHSLPIPSTDTAQLREQERDASRVPHFYFERQGSGGGLELETALVERLVRQLSAEA
jgi:hypothetical protein